MLSRAVDQAVSHRPIIVVALVRARPVHMGFVINNAALGQGFLRVLRLFLVSIIPPWLSLLICHLGDEQQVCRFGRSSET
jgi:hypothetical protein